jgi:hypothetical protein
MSYQTLIKSLVIGWLCAKCSIICCNGMQTNLNKLLGAVVRHYICWLCIYHHNIIRSIWDGCVLSNFQFVLRNCYFPISISGETQVAINKTILLQDSSACKHSFSSKSARLSSHFKSDTTGYIHLETGCVSDVISVSSSYDRRLRQLYDVVKHATPSLPLGSSACSTEADCIVLDVLHLSV